MTKLRLQRFGKKGRPFYRIVVADSRSPRNGAHIEVVGTYDNIRKETAIDEERVKYWLEKGAEPSDIVGKILRRKGFEV
jgi:small subunit ribosomal protein S16